MEPDEQGYAQQPCHSLHERIMDGNGVPAMSAFAEKDGVTEERDIVIKSDPLAALRTTGRGVDDRFLEGDAVNAYIQETADCQTEEQCEKKPH
jgi:hypothetical protein